MTLLKRARDMIAALQWSSERHYSEWTIGNVCPLCRREGEHDDDCELFVLLTELNNELGDGND